MHISFKLKAINGFRKTHSNLNYSYRHHRQLVMFCFVLGLSLVGEKVSAKTLTQAVNEQIGTVSVPCENLLNAGATPTGSLATICGRIIPAGTAYNDSIGASTNSISTDSSIKLVTQEQNKKNSKENEDMSGSKWTFFATAEDGSIDRDSTNLIGGYTSTTVRLLVGGTYKTNPTNLLGIALSGKNQNGNDNLGTPFKETNYAIRILDIYYPTENSFIQFAGGVNIKTQRQRAASFNEPSQLYSVSGSPSSDFSFNQYELSILSGYNYAKDSFVITPQIGLTLLTENYGTYTESGNSGLELVIYDDKQRSLKSNVGVQATMNISTGSGVFIPQIDLRWIHEFDDKSRQVNFSFAYDTSHVVFSYNTEAVDRDYGEIAVGIAYVMAKGKQAFARVQSVIGQELYNSTIYSIGLNFEL